jgi:mono/diheme cytochrome c family protein
MRYLLGGIAVIAMLAVTASAADDSEDLYNSRCAVCHAIKGNGSGHTNLKVKPADLTSEAVQKRSDEELYESIAFGVGHKEYPHAFVRRGLTQKQIASLVVYLRKFSTNTKKKEHLVEQR